MLRWRLQCEAWQAGSYRGHIRNGKPPLWLRETGNAEAPLYEPIPERVAALKEALRLYQAGYGGQAIAKELNQRGLSYTGKPVNGANFYKIIKRRDLLGIKLLTVDGVEYALHDYYPPVLSELEWQRLQSRKRNRTKAPGAGIPGVITGQKIARCGYCGESMSGTNYAYKAREDGSIAEGHRRLMCNAYSLRNDCPVGSSTKLGPVERAVINFCRDKMDMSALLERTDVQRRFAC